MIQKLEELARRVILGATTALVVGNSAALADDPAAATGTDPAREPTVLADAGSRAIFAKPKLMLKRASQGLSELFSFHRSHRSHSSHRSHYSSSVPSAPPRPPDTTGAAQRTAPVAPTSLGVRVLRRGMAGADVTQLMLILAKFRYLAPEHINTAGEYTAAVDSAVRAFQAANNLQATGVADSQTIVMLKQLGARP